jgi:hypothetical protein
MHEKRFYHEVVEPTMRLHQRASQNVCVEPEFNDVISLAKQAASAAYHFREPILRLSGKERIPAMQNMAAEDLRQRLGDVVDSAKHGKLRHETRETEFRASLAFEYKHGQGFRFLRTEVLAKNERFGEFELCDTLLAFMPLLAEELRVCWKIEVPSYDCHDFSEWAQTNLSSQSGFDLGSVGIRTYQRDASGLLKLVDLPEIKFCVVQS